MTVMQDLSTATVVEVSIDDTGKLWVNVDGICVLRIGKCECVTFDDPLRGFDVVYGTSDANSHR